MAHTQYEEIKSVNGKSWKSLGVDCSKLSSEEFDTIIVENKRQNIERITSMLYNDKVNSYIDDHTNNEEKIEAVVILDNDHICPVKLGSVMCLNKLYVGDDNLIHMSTRSVAGTFGCMTDANCTDVDFMQDSINVYNINADNVLARGLTTAKVLSYIILNHA